jgi:hypothetical protein
MKRSILLNALGVLLALSFGGAVQADANEDEARLQTAHKEIDNAPSSGSQQARVETLAKQFKVPPSTVEELRNKQKGWGEVTIELAMAQQLNKTDPKAYPTFADALKRIDTLRAEHKGWGEIAKEQGFKLGPVISDAKQVRHEIMKTERSEHGAVDTGRDHRDKPNGMDRPQRPDRPERPERAERHGRP